MSSKITAGAPWTGKLKVLWNALFYFRELFSRPLESYVLRNHLQRRNAKDPSTLQSWQSVVIKEAQLKRWMSHINLNWENHTLGAAFGSAELHREHTLQRALLETEERGIRKASVLGVNFQLFRTACFSSSLTDWPVSSLLPSLFRSSAVVCVCESSWKKPSSPRLTAACSPA